MSRQLTSTFSHHFPRAAAAGKASYLSLSSSPIVKTPFISMSEEYEKTTRNKQGENGNSMTGITGEITGNNWIFKNLQI